MTLCFLASCRDDRQTVDLALVSHDRPPSEHVGQAAVEQLIDAFGVDVALVVDAQHVLREVLRRLAPDLLAAGFAVEARVVAGAIQGLIGRRCS